MADIVVDESNVVAKVPKKVEAVKEMHAPTNTLHLEPHVVD